MIEAMKAKTDDDLKQAYAICQDRGHEPLRAGVGDWSRCRYCLVQYKFVLQEDPTSLPGAKMEFIEGTQGAHRIVQG